jgi:PmbA protein
MNITKFFTKAKESGIEASQISCERSSSLNISIFHGEISNYTASSVTSINARGIYGGKVGFGFTEKDESKTIDYLINTIKDSASLLENKDEPIIFKGSEKYHKKNVYNKELEGITSEKIVAKLMYLEKKIKNADPRVSEVSVEFSEEFSDRVFANSYGLKLREKGDYYFVGAEVVMKEGEEIKSFYKAFLNTDPSKFDADAIAKEAVEKCAAQLGSKTIALGTYSAVIDREAVSSLVSALISNASSEQTQKHSSTFEGKVGQKILSRKLTITEAPLTKNLFFSYFDSEGVAKYDKKIIDKGVLKTLLYNMNTAKKDGTVSTGNAQSKGSKMGVGFSNILVKKGSKSLNNLIASISDGVYITDISGLHAGLNSSSGDFSLEAQGFKIENGKIAYPLTLLTVGGNLFKLFNDIIDIGSDSKLNFNSVNAPSMSFKGLKISTE